MKIVFAGSSEFGVLSLKYLFEKHTIVGVITNPDKPAGRGRLINETPIKKIALEFNAEIYQPDLINTPDFLKKITEWNPDLFIVIGYGHILKKNLIDAFPERWINVHSSILPKYRGPAPINYALFNNEKESGITIMRINEKLDAGEILYIEKVIISEEDNFGSLYEKLSVAAVSALDKYLEDITYNNSHTIIQNEEIATYTSKITQESAHLNFNDTCVNIIAKIRGLSPTPSAWTIFNFKKLKFFNGRICSAAEIEKFACNNLFPTNGTYSLLNKKFIIKCKDGYIEIFDIQIEGKKRMPVSDFINGLNTQNVTGILE